MRLHTIPGPDSGDEGRTPRTMTPTAHPAAQASERPRSGVLLVNLGTPDAARTPEVRRYLREFLADPRVIDIPAPLPFRAERFIAFDTALTASALVAVGLFARCMTRGANPLPVVKSPMIG